jgi:hypothetical protein
LNEGAKKLPLESNLEYPAASKLSAPLNKGGEQNPFSQYVFSSFGLINEKCS